MATKWIDCGCHYGKVLVPSLPPTWAPCLKIGCKNGKIPVEVRDIPVRPFRPSERLDTPRTPFRASPRPKSRYSVAIDERMAAFPSWQKALFCIFGIGAVASWASAHIVGGFLIAIVSVVAELFLATLAMLLLSILNVTASAVVAARWKILQWIAVIAVAYVAYYLAKSPK